MQKSESIPSSSPVQPELQTAVERCSAEFYNWAKAQILDAHADKLYHNWHHTESVDDHSRTIIEVIKSHAPDAVSAPMETGRRLGALAHDLVLAAAKNEAEGKMVRATGWQPGGNEWESFQRLVNWTEQFIESESVRSDDDVSGRQLRAAMALVLSYAEAAIQGTVPNFKQELVTSDGIARLGLSPAEIGRYTDFLSAHHPSGTPLALKIGQHYVNKESGLVQLSVALGDLSQVGRVPFSAFVGEGTKELRELNYIIDEYGRNLDSMEPEQAAQVAGRVINWASVQAGFALWQWLRFEELISGNEALNRLPAATSIRSELRSIYNQFKVNIEQSMDRALRLEAEYKELSAPGDAPGPLSVRGRELLYRLYQEEIFLEN